jgi:hypothetical protein
MARPLLREVFVTSTLTRRNHMRSFILGLSMVTLFGSRAFAQAAPSPAAARAPAATPATEPSNAPAALTAPAAAPAPVVVAATPAPALQGASVWGILPWGGVGAGVRFMKPLPIPSLLKSASVRDNFSIEFGADILRWNYGEDTPYSSSYQWTEILPVCGVSWNFWFSDEFALYPKVEAGYAFGWLSNTTYAVGGYGGTFVNGAGGLLYRIGDALTLRAEVGASGLKVGAGWLF